MKANEIVTALEKRHGADKINTTGKEWAFFSELRAGTGYSAYDYAQKRKKPFNPEQRFDAWAVNLYPSKKHERVVYEIKVSRSDFLHEIKHPEKRDQALQLSNSFYFATPKGLVDKSEIPAECGLIEVDDQLNARVVVKAPFRESECLSWQFLCAIARRATVAERKVKDHEKIRIEHSLT